MKRIITILFLAISIVSYSQNVNLKFNTVSIINTTTDKVVETRKSDSEFIITQNTVYITKEGVIKRYSIIGEPRFDYIDGMQCLIIKLRSVVIEGIIIVKDRNYNGIYIVYDSSLHRCYNT